MKEFLKSVLLLLLVVTSVWQTSFFIRVQSGGRQRMLTPMVVTAKESEDNPALTRLDQQATAKLVTPPRVIAHLGGDKHALLRASSGFYNNIWNNIWHSSIAKDGTMPLQGFVEVKREAWSNTDPSVEMILPSPTPLNLWLDALGVKLEGEGFVPVVNRVYVSAQEDDEILIEDIQVGKVYRMPVSFDASILAKFLEVTEDSVYLAQMPLKQDVFGIPMANPVYVYTKAPLVAPLNVLPGPAYEQQLLENKTIMDAFFPDPSMVRLYKGNQGMDTYYDGDRMFKRIGPDWITTTQVQPDTEQPIEDDPITAMARTTARLNQWPESASELYFDGVRRDQGNTTTTYYQQAYQGKPVFTLGANSNDEAAFDRVKPSYTAENDGGTMVYYERATTRLGGLGANKEALDAIFALAVVDDRWSQLFPGETRQDKKLRDIYEAFLDDGGRLAKPVWCVEFYDGAKVLIDIYDASVRGVMAAVADR